MKKTLGLGLLLLAFSGSSLAGYVDPDEKKADAQRLESLNKYIGACKSDNKCKRHALDRAFYQFPPVRGEKPYMEKHYGNLTKGQAVAELKKLIALYPQVKEDKRNPEKWHGKVSPEAIDIESDFILKKYFGISGSGITTAEVFVKQSGKKYN